MAMATRRPQEIICRVQSARSRGDCDCGTGEVLGNFKLKKNRVCPECDAASAGHLRRCCWVPRNQDNRQVFGIGATDSVKCGERPHAEGDDTACRTDYFRNFTLA